MTCQTCPANPTQRIQSNDSTEFTDAPDRVLSTLNKDGTRRWLRPKPSPGRLLNARRIVAYSLIILFAALPWISINGKPAILLDLPAREFTFFGATFLPTDTLLLMLFLAGVFVTVFLLTALFGRLWCGWACPQTVYLEFIYRPIERLLEGQPDTKGRLRKQPAGWRIVAKYAIFLAFSLVIAHIFVSYFVGVDNLFQWVRQSPFEHPTAFIIMACVTGLMMFDFSFFREQTCIVACPYGRFQSVLLDRSSLIVSYDPKRGEPRGRLRKAKKGSDVAPPHLGDCIDCHLCVATCPTGIDIRDGLQMECINCAQCIDACNAVMRKIGRPEGLIRYSSQEAIERGRAKLLRPRVVLYPLFLAAITAAFIIVLTGRASADITLLRGTDTPYTMTENDIVRNALRLKLVNRSPETRTYRVELVDMADARIASDELPVTLDSSETRTVALDVLAPPERFDSGRATVRLRVFDRVDFDETHSYRLQGPFGSVRPSADGDSAEGAEHTSGKGDS